MKCFISYRREDTEGIAEKLYDFMLGRGSGFGGDPDWEGVEGGDVLRLVERRHEGSEQPMALGRQRT